eukprot:s9836_g1.t1
MQGQELHFGTGCSLAAQAFGVILLGSVFEAMMLLQVLMAFLLGMLGQGGPLEEALLRLLEQQATQTQLLLMMQQQQQQLQHQQQMQQLLPPPAVLPQPTFPAFPFPPPRPFTIGVPGVPVQPPTLPAGVPAQPAAICSMPAAGALSSHLPFLLEFLPSQLQSAACLQLVRNYARRPTQRSIPLLQDGFIARNRRRLKLR